MSGSTSINQPVYYLKGCNPQTGELKWSDNRDEGYAHIDYFLDSNGETISYDDVEFFTNKIMIYRQDLKRFCFTVPKIAKAPVSYNPYQKEYDFSSRVPFNETNLPQHPEFVDFFISNQNFSTKPYSMYLGHLECILRSSSESMLCEKLKMSEKIDFKNHFKNVFKIISGTNQNLKKLREESILIYNSVDLKKSSSIQMFSDYYSIGVQIIELIDENSYEKYMILPTFAEVIPNPYIKLLIYGEYVSVLYSSEQNRIDGFDDRGLNNTSFNRDIYPDSFYILDKTSSENKYPDAINGLIQILEKVEPNAKWIQSLRDLIKSTLKKFDEIKKTEKNMAKVEKWESSLISFRSLVEMHLERQSSNERLKHNMKIQNISVSQAQFMTKRSLSDKRNIVQTKNEIDIRRINSISSLSRIASSSIKSFLNIAAMFHTNDSEKNPAKSQVSTFSPQAPSSQKSLAKKGISLQYILNLRQNEKARVIRKNDGDLISNRFELSATSTPISGLKNASNSALAPCQGCNKNRKCTIIHKNCKLCDSCFIKSATVNNNCMICKESMNIETYSEKLSSLILRCKYCSNTIKCTKAQTRNCGCLLCDSCFVRYRNCNTCKNCGW